MLQVACGEFVAIFDDDDYYSSSYLEFMHRQLVDRDVALVKLGAWPLFVAKWERDTSGEGSPEHTAATATASASASSSASSSSSAAAASSASSSAASSAASVSASASAAAATAREAARSREGQYLSGKMLSMDVSDDAAMKHAYGFTFFFTRKAAATQVHIARGWKTEVGRVGWDGVWLGKLLHAGLRVGVIASAPSMLVIKVQHSDNISKPIAKFLKQFRGNATAAIELLRAALPVKLSKEKPRGARARTHTHTRTLSHAHMYQERVLGDNST